MTEESHEGDSTGFPPPRRERAVTWDEFGDTNLPVELLSSSGALLNAAANLEQRLQTCSGIYALANEVNAVREKERQLKEELLTECLHQLDDRLGRIENAVASIPSIVKDVVSKEFTDLDIERQLQTQIRESSREFSRQLDRFEEMMGEQESADAKVLKAIKRELELMKTRPKDPPGLTGLELEIADLSQKQVSLNSLVETLNTQPRL
jgi:hypothetical protein